jgi:hypothetical protein
VWERVSVSVCIASFFAFSLPLSLEARMIFVRPRALHHAFFTQNYVFFQIWSIGMDVHSGQIDDGRDDDEKEGKDEEYVRGHSPTVHVARGRDREPIGNDDDDEAVEEERSTKKPRGRPRLPRQQAKRTPETTDRARLCSAFNHFVREESSIRPIPAELLEVARKHFSRPNIKNGDLICDSHRLDLARTLPQDTVASPRRTEPLDLVLSSPIASHDVALSLVNAPAELDPTLFLELPHENPLFGKDVLGFVLSLLEGNPRLFHQLQQHPRHGVRELLSGIAHAIGEHSKPLHTDSDLIVQQFNLFCKSLPSAQEDALQPGVWEKVEQFFFSSSFRELRAFLEKMVATPGDSRNTGTQSREKKLWRAVMPLLQLSKIKSQRNSFLATRLGVYFHFRGLNAEQLRLLAQFGIVVSEDTIRSVVEHYSKKVLERDLNSLFQRVDLVAMCGDNFNMYAAVKYFRPGELPKQFNMFLAFIYRLREADPSLSTVAPPPQPLNWQKLSLGNDEWKTLLGGLEWCLHRALLDAGVEELPPWVERPHVGTAECQQYVISPLINHDSNRCSEVLVIVDLLAKHFNLPSGRTYPFYGDLLVKKYVEVASKMRKLDSENPPLFGPELGLFHTHMATLLTLLHKHYPELMQEIATVMSKKLTLKKPSAEFNAWMRVVRYAFRGLALSAYKVFTSMEEGINDKSISSFTAWIVRPFRQGLSSQSAILRNVILLLGVNDLWMRSTRIADGETIFLLIRFLLPPLATLSSKMYFPMLVRYVHETMSMSPKERAMRLMNLTINVRGGNGHAKPVDLEQEYMICAAKKLVQPLPHKTAEEMSKRIQVLPMLAAIREDVLRAFPISNVNTTVSIKSDRNHDFDQAIAGRFDARLRNEVEPTKLSAKQNPFLSMGTRYRNKIAALIDPSSQPIYAEVEEVEEDATPVEVEEDAQGIDELEDLEALIVDY